ncbi:MAG: succinylglutamate desuccinylase/aspartoacylase family protein [Fibrobacteres bacterium]|nr:succinylglutamate desuccinylase/aspartoacylase family protein [Fibrobacterota bacterium]
MQAKPSDFPASGLSVRAILANREAIERNLRYLDRDLNRCFGRSWPTPRRSTVARTATRLGACRRNLSQRRRTGSCGGSAQHHIEHGVTWILPSLSPWPLYLAWQASLADSRVRILRRKPRSPMSSCLRWGKDKSRWKSVPSPTAPISHWAWEAADSQVRTLLGTLGELPDTFDPVDALADARFEFFQTVSIERYPLDDAGHTRCVIHQSAQARDYLPLADGEPLYFDPVEGVTLYHRGATIHPVFLGEAAYVESGISFHVLDGKPPSSSCNKAGGNNLTSPYTVLQAANNLINFTPPAMWWASSKTRLKVRSASLRANGPRRRWTWACRAKRTSDASRPRARKAASGRPGVEKVSRRF